MADGSVISFLCACGHRFSEPRTEAGLSIQCPRCGRLNDVPRISDLASLDDDGTFKLGDETPEIEQERYRKLRRVYSVTRTDDAGEEIDLRNQPEELDIALSAEMPAEHRDRGDVARPKYDPETGELLRPIDLANAPPPEAMQAPLVVGYASSQNGTVSASPWLKLFEPSNAVVMIFILIAYMVGALWQFFFLVFGYQTYFINVGILFAIAHYMGVINEIAISEVDELPRPLRNLSFREDVLFPLTNFFIATTLCFAPVGVVMHYEQYLPHPFTVVATYVAGCFFFPAVVLTLATTGGLENLHPDRVLRVIHCGRFSYLFIWIGLIFVGALTLWGVAGPYAIPFTVVQKKVLLNRDLMKFVAAPAMLAHVYLAHLLCWKLGLIYRRELTRFGWVHQIHVRQQLSEAAKRRGVAMQKAIDKNRQARDARSKRR